MLLDEEVSITPEAIFIHYYSLVININKWLFIEIFKDLKKIIKKEANIVKYYYIEEEDVGVYFGSYKIKDNNIYEYIRIESYSDMEIINDDNSLQPKFVTQIIERSINIPEILTVAQIKYGYILDYYIYRRRNVLNNGKNKVDVAKLTKSATLEFPNNPEITDIDRAKFKNDGNDLSED